MSADAVDIVWIVPTLEPGASGVGDYTERLAAGMADRGWRSGFIAWNEPELVEPDESTPTRLRLPGGWSHERRAEAASPFLAHHDPAWISLQWVAFGFDSRGLPTELAGIVAEFRKGRHLHWFVHEIWLGEKPGLPWKLRFLGWLQKQLMRRFASRWSPDLVQTSNALYREALTDIGVEAEILPLVSSFRPQGEPPSGGFSNPEASAWWAARDEPALRIVLFTSIPRGVSLVGFAEALGEWNRLHPDRPVRFASLGRRGAGEAAWTEAMQSVESIPFHDLGVLPADEISPILQTMDLMALARAPVLLGKSGAFAAAVDHGLPVVSVDNPVETRRPLEPEVFPVPVAAFDAEDPGGLLAWMETVRRQPVRDRLAEIAAELDGALKAAGEG